MELFESIRHDFYLHDQSLRAIARKYNVHRRVVRQALKSALPPKRKLSNRAQPVLTPPMRRLIDRWLEQDLDAPKKQKHTAHRIFERLKRELQYRGAESTVRLYVSQSRRRLGYKLEAFVPQEHQPGEEAEVDYYQAYVDFPWGRQKVHLFALRSCFSGREFHLAFPRANQQAFLEGHVAAFEYFGGVFRRIRYDNLSSAVKKVLKGRQRQETERFLALRSHYLFKSQFCLVGEQGAHEKGGVEGGLGRFRRNHLVPVPKVEDFTALNRMLRESCCRADGRRRKGHKQSLLEQFEQEKERLVPLPEKAFEAFVTQAARVDCKSRVQAKQNYYSVPVNLIGLKLEVRIHAHCVEVYNRGQKVARHQRLFGQQQQSFVLDHYLELLRYKPGALEGSSPLSQARQQGQFPACYDLFWQELKARHGESQGTKQLLEVLFLHREHDPELVLTAVGLALEYSACEAAAVRSLLRQLEQSDRNSEPLKDLGKLSRYDRAKPDLKLYDHLLGQSRILQALSPLALLVGGGS